jgi:serralysin
MPWSRTTRRLVGTVALVPVVLVAGALAGCTPTSGGTAYVVGLGCYGQCASTFRFDAVTGRNNSITVSLVTDGGFYPRDLLLTDSRNPVTPGTGCTRVNDNTVLCSADDFGYPNDSHGFINQDIRLGDGDDTFATSVYIDTLVDAGVGNDTVNGGPANDDLHAGTGDDTVNGGAGFDELYEDSDEFDRDSFVGGADSDRVRYEGVLHAVNVSLNGVADDGRPGEGDNVKSDIEWIAGTGTADTLTGNDAGNGLWGGAGKDVLRGGAGNDGLYGREGDDGLYGGAGDDTLYGDEGVDAHDGGSGTDYCDVWWYGGGDTTVNCETFPDPVPLGAVA